MFLSYFNHHNFFDHLYLKGLTVAERKSGKLTGTDTSEDSAKIMQHLRDNVKLWDLKVDVAPTESIVVAPTESSFRRDSRGRSAFREKEPARFELSSMHFAL